MSARRPQHALWRSTVSRWGRRALGPVSQLSRARPIVVLNWAIWLGAWTALPAVADEGWQTQVRLPSQAEAQNADFVVRPEDGWAAMLGATDLSAPATMLVLGFAAVLAFGLLGGVAYAVRTRVLPKSEREMPQVGAQATGDDRQACLGLVEQAASLWRNAEAAVLKLDETAPIRAHLLQELRKVEQQLSRDVNAQSMTKGALTTEMTGAYWKLLRQRLRRTIRDLDRIVATANAAIETLGSNEGLEPRIPKTREEALLVLGASQGADGEVLNRLVKALRQCWHPDLALSDADRKYRDARLTQINVAYDILTGRRVEG